MTEKLIGTKEFRERLGCGKTFALELIHRFRYRGQAYKVGRCYKVDERIFKDWLEHECKIEGRTIR